MDGRWVKGLKGDDKEARKKELQSYRTAFEALKEILEEEFEDASPSYEHAAWPYEAADRYGANRKLRSIIQLLKVD